MKQAASSLLIGIIFAFGLGISGMTQPKKVIGFLDVFGEWDPSLAFVMGGALVISMPLTQRLVRRSRPIFAQGWDLPATKAVNKSLIIGSFLFGVGWGLAGYCPGPAVTALASGQLEPLVFVVSMIGGMFVFQLLEPFIKQQQ